MATARTRAATTIFVWVAAMGVLAKIWRATDLLHESGATDGFTWLPLGVAAEVLVGFIAALVVVAVAAAADALARRINARSSVRAYRVGAAAGVALGLANVWWLGLNLVSFRVTQAPLTYQRVRGDEGVQFRDANLVSFNDVAPSVWFAVAALVALPLAYLAVRSLLRTRALDRRVVAGVLALASLAYGVDAFVFRAKNFGAADNPALGLVASFVHGYVDEHRAPPKSVKVDDLHALLASRIPRTETALPPRGRAEMKNAIVFFSEGIARKHTSLAGTGATPNLERRFHQSGLELTRYYAPYHKSIAAIYSFMCSDFPPPTGTNIVEINPRIDCGEFSDVLSASGFHTGLFHGGDFGFYDKLALLGMRGYEIMEDARVISDPLRYDENEWGVDDRAMVDHVLAWIDSIPPGDRFAAVMIPITAHYPYWFPEDADVAFPGDDGKDRFLSAVHFLDESFERLMAGLEARGLAGDTAVIYLADHGETVGERPRESPGRRLAYEPSLHVPFVILAPGMWPGASQSDRLASHVDLLPTVLDLLGLPPDARHHGRSILEPDREPERIFVGASNGPRWIGFIDGDQKFLLNRTTGAREAYDLTKDPDERHDIASELGARGDRLERDALAFADGHMAEIEHAKKRDAEIDVQTAFMAATTLRTRAADGTVHDGAAVIRARVAAPGDKRDCVVVETPKNGAVELEVRAQPWFPLLSRVRVGVTAPKHSEGSESARVVVVVDGAVEAEAVVSAGASQRLSFPAARDSLLVRVSGDGGDGAMKRDVCLTFTDRAWRGKSAPPPPR